MTQLADETTDSVDVKTVGSRLAEILATALGHATYPFSEGEIDRHEQ